MPRYIFFLLACAMAGCAQTPFAPAGMPNAGTMAMKPAESVKARITYKNEDPNAIEFLVYWSYPANPFWYEEVYKCVRPGNEFDTQIVYNHPKDGPQIRFGTIASAWPDKCPFVPKSPRTITFYGMHFDPYADFHVKSTFNPKDYIRTMCAHGGGNKEVCVSGLN